MQTLAESGNHPFVYEELPQCRLVAEELLAEDIERHSLQEAFLEGSEPFLLVKHPASCTVHQACTRFEHVQLLGTK